MLRSPLFKRFFFSLLGVLLGYSLSVYFFSVPSLRNLVHTLEEHTAKTILSNVNDLVTTSFLAIKAHEDSVVDAHRRELKTASQFGEAFLRSKYNLVENGLLGEEEAKLTGLEELQRFRLSDNVFVWVADFDGRYLAHPDPALFYADFSNERDVFGNPILMPLIDQALLNGEGFHTYWWQRPSDTLPAKVLAHARLFPEWQLVIGTGVYLDKLEEEVVLRKEQMINDLREVLRPITIAESGNLFIFDSWQNIIVHPDAALENTSFANVTNPSTGKSLAEDIMEAADTAGRRLQYREPGETGREMVTWVDYVSGFDWYIACSVPMAELDRSADSMRRKIITVSAIVFGLTTLLIVLLMERLLKPIRLLSATAARVGSGDLSARCAVGGNDEIGTLASAFNTMVDQLKSHIEELDEKVLERTKELDERNEWLENEIVERRRAMGELEKSNKRISLLHRMGAELQACNNLEDTFAVVSSTLAGLFANSSGGLYLVERTERPLQRAAVWGDSSAIPPKLEAAECPAVHQEAAIRTDLRHPDQLCCQHLEENGDTTSFALCLPLVGREAVIGLLFLLFDDRADQRPAAQRTAALEAREKLARAAADHIALALANIMLRERLREQSVRDGLTGLFNRRYMEETLEREFHKAQRDNTTVCIIMLDVDFFKKFNDTYGHEAGDIVLIELGRTLEAGVRKEDVVCRYGGEEFFVILPKTSLEEAGKRAETLRASVQDDLRITYGEARFQVTISLGVAAFPGHGESIEAVMNRADAALYASKQAGRNRVTVSPAIPS